MTPKEHAEIYRRAARIVAGMDPRNDWRGGANAGGASATGSGGAGGACFSYSSADGARWDSFNAAADVLNTIADEFDPGQ